jgi:hypothetical protein
MSRLTLRSQVAIASAIAILLAAALLGVALHLLLSRELHRQLDSDLRRRAADVATLSVSAPALLTSPGAHNGEITDGHAKLSGNSSIFPTSTFDIVFRLA